MLLIKNFIFKKKMFIFVEIKGKIKRFLVYISILCKSYFIFFIIRCKIWNFMDILWIF